MTSHFYVIIYLLVIFVRNTLIKNFLRISSVPRGTGNEKGISDFFVNIAKTNNLYYYQDENYNLIIKKKGNIDGKPIGFQAHFDMVCRKTEESSHDFTRDGIDVIIDENKVTARDTTLGADQGVGLAIMLALIESTDIIHPDLEFLFTVEEETTFKGAVTFPYDKVTVKQIINLDNSYDNSVITASAGDILNEYSFNIKFDEKNIPSYKILIDNVPGGNSGDYVELSKNNAIALMASLLVNKGIYLKSINGGSFENDIATWCEAIIQTDNNIGNLFDGLDINITSVDDNLSLSITDTNLVLNEILNLNSGYISKTATANLGVITTDDTQIKIKYLIRSTDADELDKISNETKNLNNNFKVSEIYTDNVWKIKDNSELLKKYKKAYYVLFKEYPSEMTCNGGIEVSAIQGRLKDTDIICIGANMENFHTVNEVTYIDSWIKEYKIILKILGN